MKGRWRGWGEQIPEIAVLSLPVTQEALSKAFSSSFLFLFFSPSSFSSAAAAFYNHFLVSFYFIFIS